MFDGLRPVEEAAPPTQNLIEGESVAETPSLQTEALLAT
jgi:hypothetical protein